MGNNNTSYIFPFSSEDMTPSTNNARLALEEASAHSNDLNYPYFDDCWKMIINSKSFYYIYFWALSFDLYRHECFEFLLKNVDYYYYIEYLASWFSNSTFNPQGSYYNQAIKIKMIELEKVKDFIEHVKI